MSLFSEYPLLHIGPYEVKARLGRGGMGDVFLAQHESTGKLVAIKRVREVETVQLASLRREIYALSRIRHPGIVRLVDHGTVDGLPWCALEFVEGETLQAILEPQDMRPTHAVRDTPSTATMDPFDVTGPLGDGLPYLPRVVAHAPLLPPPPHVVAKGLAALKRLCPPLGFLHGEGIVHCDIKPANLVLRPSGMPVIIDFGLMVHFSGPHGRDRLDEVWSAVGTFEYMAPERIRRELVDARADLYAVGCMLYEILTGRPPFVGDPRQILGQHMTTRPLAPSELVPEVRPDLDDLVMRLLEKDPRDRLGYADSIEAALAAAGVGDGAADEPGFTKNEPSSISSGSISSSSGSISGARSSQGSARLAPHARGYLYRPTFAGHVGALRGITTEPGGLVLVGAESGAGKTRFAMEVGRALAGEMRVVTGECLPLGTEGAAVLGAPLHPIAPLLRAIVDECRSQGPGMTEMVLGRRGRVLADYEPSLLDLPEVAELPPPARLSPEAAQQRLYDELAETMFAFALLQRIVLILDDLQWADELTLGFLRSLSPSSLSDQGVLVIGTYRKDEAGEALRQLVQQRGVKHVELKQLDREAVASIARDMLALSDPPEALIDRLNACSDGNPFFVAEYLRAAVEDGLLVRDAKGSWTAGPRLGAGADLATLPTPGSVRDLLVQRLDALAPGAQLWVEAASVLGREIDREILEKVVHAVRGSTAADAAPPSTGRSRLLSVEELLARQILEEMPRGFRFVHDMLREVADERIPTARKKLLHLAAATATEEVFAARHLLPSAYAALAHHYGAAEVDDKTFLYLELAAESALASGTYVQAHAFLTRAIGLDAARGRPSPALSRARWNRWLGEAAYALGDLTGLGSHTEEGLAELGLPMPRTPLAWGRALVTGLLRQGAAIVGKRLAPAGLLAPRAQADSERTARAESAQMAAQLAFRYYFGGNAAALITTSLLAVNEAERASAGSALGVATRGLSRPYAYLGYLSGLARLHPLADAYFQQAVSAGHAANDSDGVAFARTTQAVYLLGRCDWSAAERAAQEALQIQIANANAMDAALLHTILGHIEYFTGRFEASRRRFDTLHASAKRHHNEQHSAWGLYATARCFLAEGRTDAALPLLHEAERILANLSDEASELIVSGLFASAHLARGELGAAAERADRIARRIDRPHVPTVFSTVHAYVALAEVRLRLWEEEGGEHAAAALRASALLTGFATLFPFALPAAQRCGARARGLLGFRAEAMRGLRIAADSARRRGMPYDEVLAVLELARLEQRG